MKKWEYKLKKVPYLAKGDLNNLGKQGWELVGTTDITLYFKRPIEESE